MDSQNQESAFQVMAAAGIEAENGIIGITLPRVQQQPPPLTHLIAGGDLGTEKLGGRGEVKDSYMHNLVSGRLPPPRQLPTDLKLEEGWG